MTIQKILHVAFLAGLSNLNPNARYKALATDWQKCFRILSYLYTIYSEDKLEIKSGFEIKENKETDKRNREKINNNYFQSNDFWKSIKDYLIDKLEKENEKKIDVKSLINYYFDQDIISQDDIRQVFCLTPQESNRLLALTPFDVTSRTINNDLDKLSKILLKEEYIINTVEKEYRKKPQKFSNNNNKTIKLFGKKFSLSEKIYKNEKQENLTPFYIIKYIFKNLLKSEYDFKKIDQLTDDEIKIILENSLRLCMETISIYPEIFDDRKKLDNNKINKIRIQAQLNELKPQNEQELLNLLKINKNQLDDWLKFMFPQLKKQPEKNELNQRLQKIFYKSLLKGEDVEKETISNDLDELVKLDIITVIKTYAINNNLNLDTILNINNDDSNTITSSNADLLTTFQDIYFDYLLSRISDNFKDQRRFFIKFQHINEGITKLEHIVEELKHFWKNNDIQLISIKYASSSQNGKKDDYLIYPISLFYNQRGIYLAGYGETPLGEKWKLDYYNYRLDHLCSQKDKENKNKYIIPIKWDENNDKIDSLFIENQEEIQSENSQTIYNELSKALGVDIHKEIKTMLLRFPQKFHKNYIEGSRRHTTFQQIKFSNLREFWQGLREKDNRIKITENDQKLIKERIKDYPDDAYYTMNYRHGKEGGNDVEADVIMRLRAWCPNVEVLLPWDLRKRMREDMEKTYELYKENIQ